MKPQPAVLAECGPSSKPGYYSKLHAIIKINLFACLDRLILTTLLFCYLPPLMVEITKSLLPGSAQLYLGTKKVSHAYKIDEKKGKVLQKGSASRDVM